MASLPAPTGSLTLGFAGPYIFTSSRQTSPLELAKAHAWARWVADPPVRDVADELQPAGCRSTWGGSPTNLGLRYDSYLQIGSMK